MKSNLITVIPVYNGEKFIGATLESVAKQTLKPDRVIVQDNCSTDNTEKIVRDFKGIQCEWVRNPSNLGIFGNCNRALERAPETRHLLLLCADDLIEPKFFEVMTAALEKCDGLGLAWCLDQRIDEHDKPLSIAGKPDSSIVEVEKDAFLSRKA